MIRTVSMNIRWTRSPNTDHFAVLFLKTHPEETKVDFGALGLQCGCLASRRFSRLGHFFWGHGVVDVPTEPSIGVGDDISNFKPKGR